MNKEDKHFIQRYEELLDKGYCDCNEMNCIDNNSPRRILNIVKNQDKEIERLNNIIKRFEEDLREMYITFGEFSEEYTENKLKELKGDNERQDT